MTINILHLTDFHLDCIESENELLRKGYYKEYINGLVKCMGIQNCLDKIVITGDFIDKYKHHNFKHANDIINYLLEKTNLSNRDVYLVPGNHDIDRREDENGNENEAREQFNQFRDCYADTSVLNETNRAKLLEINESFYALLLDSTIGAKGKDHPGTFTTKEADYLIEWLNSIGKNGILMICSHNPIDNSSALIGPADEDDPDWAKRHIWQSAGPFLVRIKENLDWNGKIIWVSGDVHRHVFDDKGKHVYVITGRFGGDNKVHTEQRQQARLITIASENECSTKLAEYSFYGHSAHSYMGEWGITNFDTARESMSSSIEKTVVNEQEVDSEIVRAFNEEDIKRSSTNEAKYNVFDKGIEDSILKIIENDKLYKFGRFVTSEENVSLSWVPVSELVNGMQDSFPMLMDAMRKWLLEKVGDSIEKEKVVILGLDSWGSIIASQLTIQTNIKNYCLASRGNGKYHESNEKISKRLVKHLKYTEIVVIVVDVLASGQSFDYIYKTITNGLGSGNNIMRWLGVALIYDPSQNRGSKLDFVDSIGAGCTALKMPLINDSELPEYRILSPEVNWVN